MRSAFFLFQIASEVQLRFSAFEVKGFPPPIGTPPSTGKAAEKEQKVSEATSWRRLRLFESTRGGRVFLIPAALRSTPQVSVDSEGV